MSIAMRVDLLSGVAVEPESGLPRHLPYAFAKRHGVLALEESDDGIVIACRPDVS